MKVKDLQAELARFNPDSHITANGGEIDCVVGQPASHKLDIECGMSAKDEEKMDELEADVESAEKELAESEEQNRVLREQIEELENELEEAKK